MIEYALLFAAGCYGIALLLDLWRIAVGSRFGGPYPGA
jgi:multicomponent K+:H+ antiporter subunit F